MKPKTQSETNGTDLLSIAFNDGVATEKARVFGKINKVIEKINNDNLLDGEVVSMLHQIVETPPF
jgi:hypothetical protein